MQLTPDQIEGIRILAEVEGMYHQEENRIYLHKHITVNYLHDWNDLHRCWQVIKDKLPIAVWHIFKPDVEIGLSKNDKIRTFNALVSAAKCIKQLKPWAS